MQAVIRYPVKLVLTGVFFLGLFVFLLQIPLSGSAYAAENQDMSTVPVLTAKDSIASIGVYDVTVKNQTGNEITLDFDIVNRDSLQSNIVYTVNLFQKDDTTTPLDQKAYTSDVLNFGVGETVHKEITYSAPTYLNGTYILGVQIKNTDGLVMGLSQSSEFSLTGNGEHILIDQKSCFLTIDDKADRYTLDQGVDISKEETLVAHCSLKSNFPQDISVTPVIETRYRSDAGKVIGVEKQNALSIPSKGVVDFVVKLPKMAESQSYNAIVTFVDKNNTSISSPVDFHYVVQGQGATIQNFTLDKDSYIKGDVAKADMFWTGTEAHALGARVASVALEKGTTISILITDNQNKACISEFSQPINTERSSIKDSFEIPVTSNCTNPIAMVKIVGVDGKILAQNKYTIASKNSVAPQDVVVTPQAKQNSFAFLIYGIAFVLIILLLVYLMKKNKKTRVKVFVGLLMGLGMFVSGGYVKADTYSVPFWYGYYPYQGYVGSIEQSTTGLTVDINSPRRSYAPGSNMTVFGTSFTTAWAGTFGSKLTATVNGVTKVVTDGTFPYAGTTDHWPFPFYKTHIPSPSFVVPNTPGTYNVTFTLYEYVFTNDSNFMSGTWDSWCKAWIQTSPNGPQLCGNTYGTASYAVATANITYTVVAPTPINGVCGTAINTCASGNLVDVADEASKYLWNCDGVNGGTNAWCNTCRISSWGPDTSSQCSGVHFKQTSNCGSEQDVIGTGLGIWTPDPSDVCSSKTVDQTRCGETRRVNGTKVCPTGKWNEISPVK